VDGGDGLATLNVDNTSDATPNSGVLTATTLTGLGMGVGITYGGVKVLNISLGGGGNTFNVQATAAGTATTLNTGAGNDAVTVDSNGTTPNGTVTGVVSSLTINGEGGSNVLTLEDSSAATGARVHVNPTQIGADASDTFFGAGGFLNYSQLDQVFLNMSNAYLPDSIYLTPSPSTEFFIRGGDPHTPLPTAQQPGDALYLNITGLTAAQRRGVHSSGAALKDPTGQPPFNVWNIPGHGSVYYKQIERTGTFVDTTPPTVTGVPRDGLTAPDIDFQTSTTMLSANWAGVFADAQSGITNYEWKVGTTPGGSELFDFTPVGIITSATDSSHTLTPGQVYYVTVRATNGVGLTTTATSNGVVVYPLTVTEWTRGKPGFSSTMTIAKGAQPLVMVGRPTCVPPGLTVVLLSGNTLSFTGTPSAAGTFNGRITLKDIHGVLITGAFTININPAPTFTPATLAPYQSGKFYSQTITAAGGTGTRMVSYTLSGPLPTGLTISPPSPTTGAITISGTTKATTSVTLTLTVTDSIGAQRTITYKLAPPVKRPSRLWWQFWQ
jgi:hypothetical protein